MSSEKEKSNDSKPRKTSFDIEVESPGAKRTIIIGLAVPSLGETFLNTMVQIVDMIMVGTLGAYAIAAVGLVTQPKFIMIAAFIALNVGSTAIVARYKGARDPENANLAFHQAMIMSLGIAFILCMVMFFWGDAVLRFLAGSNISDDIINGANSYLRIQVYGFPALSLTFTINATLRGAGNTRIAFYNNLAANLVNIVFNYCLIEGHLGFPALGVAGASIATVIGQCVAFGMALSKVLSGKEFVHLQLKKLFNVDFSMMKRILNIGLPALIEQVILRTGTMLFTKIVATLGDISLAAHMVALNVHQISFMIGVAFAPAATTLVGQCLGRKRADLARLYIKMTQQLNFLISIVISIFLFFGGPFITSFFTKNSELTLLAANMIKIIAVIHPFNNARFVYLAALRGAGDSRFAAIISFIAAIAIRPLLSIILIIPQLPFQLGLAGIWIALSSDGFICYVLAWQRFIRGKWETIKV